MTRHLPDVMIAVLVVAATLLAGPAFADHRAGNVVVMGGSWPLTGRYVGIAADFLTGRKLYVEELNARGGLLAHKVKLRLLDDNSNRRTAIELYEKLITEGNIDLFLQPLDFRFTLSLFVSE